MLWRRQSLTSQEPLASQGWRNCVRVITDHEPGPATPLTARQVTPLMLLLLLYMYFSKLWLRLRLYPWLLLLLLHMVLLLLLRLGLGLLL